MTSISNRLSRFLPVACAGLLAVCGGGGSPSKATPPSPASPSPSPSPPAATPQPATACSRIGLGTGSGKDCPHESPSFLPQLDQAIDRLIQQRPEIFSFDGGVVKVVSVGQYYVGLIDGLDALGLCADYDGEELQVKSSNAFNDQYDILTASQVVFRGTSSYRSTCYPAAFPTPMPPLPPTAGCPLPPSKEKACGRESETLLSSVEASIDQVQREHPEYFDFADVQPGSNWVRILNAQGYTQGVVDALTKKGLCARYDGEELAVKKENRYSEQFDIYSDSGGKAYARRGPGAYRVTCYPAAF